MAQPAFRPYKGKWLLKDFTMIAVTSSAKVEIGDMIKFTDTTPATVRLATDAADCLVGISAGDYNTNTATQQVKIWVPAEPKSEFIGLVTAGIMAVGDTDAGRTCEMESHEGIDVDTTEDKNIYIVKGIKAYTTDGNGTATTCTTSHPGVGVFRIAQTPEKRDSW